MVLRSYLTPHYLFWIISSEKLQRLIIRFVGSWLDIAKHSLIFNLSSCSITPLSYQILNTAVLFGLPFYRFYIHDSS
nr:unnamed protein product [Callosobruchus analis]